MTSDDWWRLGSRLLGVYFLVEGALTATGALMILGAVIPETSPRWPFVLTPIVQGGISTAAGGWLMRGSRFTPASAPGNADAARLTFIRALQLVGIFFLVTGSSELGRAAVDSYYTDAGYEFRVATVAAGAVYAIAGALLVSKPSRIADRVLRLNNG